MTADALHDRLLSIVKSLPETVEDWPWGSIHCKVAGKIFVGWGRGDDGIMSVGFRTNLDLQAMLVDSDPRFSIAKYVGKYGGVDMRIGERPDWAEVEQFIVESYRIIAPKRLVKVLDARAASPAAAPSPSGAKKPAAKEPAAKKPAAKEPAAKKPAAKKPAAKKPAAKKPAAKKPAAKRPAGEAAPRAQKARKRASA